MVRTLEYTPLFTEVDKNKRIIASHVNAEIPHHSCVDTVGSALRQIFGTTDRNSLFV